MGGSARSFSSPCLLAQCHTRGGSACGPALSTALRLTAWASVKELVLALSSSKPVAGMPSAPTLA